MPFAAETLRRIDRQSAAFAAQPQRATFAIELEAKPVATLDLDLGHLVRAHGAISEAVDRERGIDIFHGDDASIAQRPRGDENGSASGDLLDGPHELPGKINAVNTELIDYAVRHGRLPEEPIAPICPRSRV